MPSFAFPSNDAIWGATLSMTNESTDSDYAVENLQDNDPANTARATGTSTVITVQLAGNVTPIAAAFYNSNATSAALSNDAGLNEAFTIPSRTADGKPLNPWIDLTGLANRTDDTFYYTMSKSGSVPLETGRLSLLLPDLEEIEIVWAGAGPSPQLKVKRPGQYENRTRLGSTPRRASPVAAPRYWTGTVILDAYLATLRQLEQEANGLNRGFFWLYDEDANDAVFAQLVNGEFQYTPEQPDLTTVQLSIEEIAMGLPPALT